MPCGKCVECINRYRSDWIIRTLEEAKSHKYFSFITLTYANKFLPRNGNNYPTLRKVDVQNLFKTWRNKDFAFTYYMCGEYGTKGGFLRPHYHILIFYDELIDVKYLCSFWKYGITHYILHNGATFLPTYDQNQDLNAIVTYIAKYACKSVGNGANIPIPDDIVKPYIACSKGFGKAYFNSKQYLENVQHYLNTSGSSNSMQFLSSYSLSKKDGTIKVVSLPRYYAKKLFDTGTHKVMQTSWQGKSVVSAPCKNYLGRKLSRTLQRRNNSSAYALDEKVRKGLITYEQAQVQDMHDSQIRAEKSILRDVESFNRSKL